MFVARLQDRYGFADWNWVINKCTAFPADCKQWSWIELWSIESHNDAVLEWTQRAMAQTQAHYQAEYERAYAEEVDRRRRVGAALQAFGNSMAQPKIHCTSTTAGTVTTTNCN